MSNQAMTGNLLSLCEALKQQVRDRKRVQDELQRAKEEAEAAARSKSAFLANMSHEIRTPMTAILGFTDTLLIEEPLSPSVRTALTTIKRNGEYLLDLINDILDLSKIEAGRMDVEQIVCPLPELLQDVYSLMRNRAEIKALHFSLRLKTLIPTTIRTDPTRLRQILINLLGNAIKFTRRGAVELEVRTLEAGPAGPAIEFSVHDTGVGMDAEQVSRLFQPFTQGDQSTTRTHGGTGLGLAITRNLARQLGGDVTVASEPGVGSVFTARVAAGPLEGVPRVGLTPVSQDVDELGRITGLPACRILVAEDGKDNQRLITHILKKAGASVAAAENGEIAVWEALAADPPFDLVIMDMQMPVLDGYSATQILRGQGYSHPILALTASTMSGDRDRCLAAGCDDYAPKPIHRDDLLSQISQLLKMQGSCPVGTCSGD